MGKGLVLCGRHICLNLYNKDGFNCISNLVDKPAIGCYRNTPP